MGCASCIVIFIPSPSSPFSSLSGVSIAITNAFCVTMYSDTFNLTQTNSEGPVYNLLVLLTDGCSFVGLSFVNQMQVLSGMRI